MIDIDLTVIIQFVNFLITLIILNRLLIRPIREQIVARRKTMSELKDSAEALNARAETALANYRNAINEAHKHGSDFCSDARKAAEEEGLLVTNKASAQARDIVHTAALASAAATAESRKVLHSKLPELAQKTISGLIGSAAKSA